MKKSTLAIFGVFAAIFVGLIPFFAINGEGQPGEGARVASVDEGAKELFQVNCGSCHKLDRAGTDGVVGPDLDELLGLGTPESNYQRVLTAIDQGIAGRMPAGILSGARAKEVADFVARVAGQ